MTASGGWGKPGVGSDRTVTESEILWGADHARNGALWQSGVIGSATRDAGNTPTTILRPGLLLGKLTSSGEFEDWDPNAIDGTQDLRGILDTELNILDLDATAADRVFRVLVGRAPVKSRKLLIEGSAFIDDTHEYMARRALHAAGFILDDDPFGYEAGAAPRYIRVTGTTDTLTVAENGAILFYSNAASVTVTLPTIIPGLEYTMIREGDEEFVIASTTGGDVIAGHDIAANGVTFTTATEHIGAAVRVRSVYMGTTLKWVMEMVQTPFGTAAGSAVTMAVNT